MKKLIALLIALVLVLSAFGALAETQLTEYATVDASADASLISGGSLLRVRDGNGYALAALDGTQLTAGKYGSSFSWSYGWIVAYALSDDDYQTSGLLSPEGEVVMPFQYGDIRVKNANWAIGVTLALATQDNYDYSSFSGNNYYLIDTVDVYYLPEAKCVASLPRANFADWGAYGDVINIEDRATGVVTAYDAQFNALGEVKYTSDSSYAGNYTTFSENGQQGLKDPDGNVVLAPAYKYVHTDVTDGCFIVETGDTVGLASLDGEILVPAEYERINTTYDVPGTATGRTYVVNGYVCVVKDGKLGYYSVGSGESCTPRYAKDNLNNNGMSADFTDMGGTFTILAADGTETPVEGYERVSALSWSAGLYYRVSDGNHYGLIDWHGNEVLPCEFDTLTMDCTGNYLVTSKGYKEPTVVYAVTWTPDAAPAPTTEESEAQAIEAQAAVAGEEAAASASDSPAAQLLGTAKQLLSADAAANGPAAVGILQSAVTLLEGNDAAVGVLNSAITLLNLDPAANGASVLSLLETVAGML